MRSFSARTRVAAILACLAATSGAASCTSDAPATPGPEGDARTDAPEPLPARDGAVDVSPDAGGDEPLPTLPPVVTENQLPGTEAWQLESPATDHEIEGYASETSVAAGATLRIFVSTASPLYTIDVYRLGWYGGKGARLVLGDVERTGHAQIMPAPDADGLVECDWTDPYELSIPQTWVSGIYLAKLTTKDTGKQSYVPFVVRDDVRAATYLVQSSVTTFQAYNNWGGKSLYDFNSDGEVRASRVSFHRPYALGLNPESAAGVGAGEIVTNLQGAANTGPMGWEYPMVRFLEREGFDVSYATNIDVHRDATLVGRHRVFVSVGHDEYWSSAMRDHVEYARDHDGTSVALLSGNVSYWQVRLSPSKTGAPFTTMLCTKDAATDPASITADVHETTVLFRDPLVARSEEGLGGLMWQDYDVKGDLVVSNPSSWVFAGTGLAAGAKLAGLLGYEIDGVREPPPPGVRAVMRSPWTTPRATSGVSSAVVRELPNGAATFAAGSIQLAWGLDSFRPAGVTQPDVMSADATTVARNVLTRLAAPAVTNASTLLLAEDFTAGLSSSRWARRTLNEGTDAFDPTLPVEVTGGRLVIRPREGVAGLAHGGVTSAVTYPMTCAAASVELVQAASAATSADTTFAVVVDPSRWYRMTVEGGTLSLGAASGGVTTKNIPYDAVAHRRLRLRHDCASDTVLFETSPDGVTWTTQRSVAREVDLRAAYLELEAGTYQPEDGPGEAIFDDLSVEARGVRATFDTQRDPEVLVPASLHRGGYDPDLRVFHSDGALHLRPRAQVPGAHHLGYATTRAIDWTGGVAGVAVLRAPAASSASFALAVVTAGGWARFTIAGGSLALQSHALGVVSGASIPFDAAAHGRLRLRHDQVPDQLVWETSADGVSWVERRRIARPFALAGARAEIVAGTDQLEASPGELVVDDFVFAR